MMGYEPEYEEEEWGPEEEEEWGEEYYEGDEDWGEEAQPDKTTQLSWCDARRSNALARDFTVNSMMYDPFSGIVYDYAQGMADCRYWLPAHP